MKGLRCRTKGVGTNLQMQAPEQLWFVEVHPCPRKVDVRLPGKGDSNSSGARPVR